MGKTVESPVKRWPGHVVIVCPVPLDPYMAWKDAVDKLPSEETTIGDVSSTPTMLRAVLPGICAMIEKWELGGDFPQHVTPETFPYIPRMPSYKLIVWLMSEINQVIGIEDDLPLA